MVFDAHQTAEKVLFHLDSRTVVMEVVLSFFHFWNALCNQITAFGADNDALSPSVVTMMEVAGDILQMSRNVSS